ncbi:hypothetical protein [Aurantibacter sp.]|uniref:HORMA-1 domain-containing protein n=1 Tax=Aurantibacter sp. TaxID=2807103 RepID=UPI003267CA27
MKHYIVIIIMGIISYNNYAQSSSIKENINLEKSFVGFKNDLINISKNTDKWSAKYAKKVSHDVAKLAEAKYLKSINIILLDFENKPILANKYVVGLKHKAFRGKGIKKLNWLASENSSLAVVLNYNLSWHRLTNKSKKEFMKKNNFKIGWITSHINTAYTHLTEVEFSDIPLETKTTHNNGNRCTSH